MFKLEAEALETLGQRIEIGSIVLADEAAHWDALHTRFLTKRINHEWAYSDDSACTSAAESVFSRLRRTEVGTHHHVAGPYPSAYAAMRVWRKDNRRLSNGEQYLLVVHSALERTMSRKW